MNVNKILKEFKREKKEAAQIARELLYPEKVIRDIENAPHSEALEDIMRNARKGRYE